MLRDAAPSHLRQTSKSSKDTPPGSPIHGSATRRASSAEQSFRRASNASVGQSPGQSDEKVKYDVLTLRQWFNYMDVNHNGNVSKEEWFQFLRCNPRLRQMLLHGNIGQPRKDRFSEESQDRLRQEAKEIKRLLRIMREVDSDRSGTMEFEEFVEIFRRAGNLIEYGADNHPRARLASIVGRMHANPQSINEALVDEFEQLAKWNMYGERRQSLEDDVLHQVQCHGAAATRMVRRRSVEPLRRDGLPDTPRPRRASDFSAVGSRMLGLG